MYTSLSTLTLALAASARSIYPRTTVAQGAQSCTANDSGNAVTYTVLIGTPFDGDLCHTIDNTLNSAVGGTVEWRTCESHASGENYKLLFEYNHNHGAQINSALGSIFTSINGFNCPDY